MLTKFDAKCRMQVVFDKGLLTLGGSWVGVAILEPVYPPNTPKHPCAAMLQSSLVCIVSYINNSMQPT